MKTIEGRSEIDEVIRIERINDPHTISDKIFDFSSGTIEGLLEEGHDNAKMELKNKSRAELEKIR
jgi:NTE family protein